MMAPPSQSLALGVPGGATPRSSTPTSRSAASSLTQRSSVVPFVRPPSTTTSASNENEAHASGSSSLPRSLPGSLRAARSAAAAAAASQQQPASSGSARATPSSSLRRPTWRGATAAVPPPAATRVTGFNAVASSSSATTTTTTTLVGETHAPSHSSTPPAGQTGLLSRVLCVDGLAEKVSSASKESTASDAEKPRAASSAVEVDTDALFEGLKSSHPIFAHPLVRQAWSVATAAHAGQARSAAAPSQPLIEHCAEVARTVAELLSGDPEAVAAAVLHEALGRGVATADALAEVGVPDKVVALVSSVARMSDLCAVRRFTTGEASGGGGGGSGSSSPSGSPVGSLAREGGGATSTSTTVVAPPAAAPSPDASAFVAMLLSMSDVRAVVVKLADRLCDLRSSAAAAVAEAEAAEREKASASSSTSSSSENDDDINRAARRAVADPSSTPFASAVAARDAARDALSLYAPLANRLGVWSLKAALEDAAFALLHPEEAASIAAALAPPERAQASLQRALDALKAKLEEVDVATRPSSSSSASAASASGNSSKSKTKNNSNNSLAKNADLSGRPKNLYGVYRKMLAKGPGATPASIHDARAVRVLVPSKADCYSALRAVHALWKPADEENPFKDYIRRPKDNGYQSLHTVVLVDDEDTGEATPLEVQIRTAKMHLVAEFGVAAHWRYKEESSSAAAEANEAAAMASSSSKKKGGGGEGLTSTTAAATSTLASSDEDFFDENIATSSSEFEDAQVAWARWLITWAHELEDKKARASSAAREDDDEEEEEKEEEREKKVVATTTSSSTSTKKGGPLAALAGAVGSATAASSSSKGNARPRPRPLHSSSCAFPTHAADCAFVDFMANTLSGQRGLSSNNSNNKQQQQQEKASTAAASAAVPSSTVAMAPSVASALPSPSPAPAAASVPTSSSTCSERVLVAVLDHTTTTAATTTMAAEGGAGATTTNGASAAAVAPPSLAAPRVEAVAAGTTAVQLALRLAAAATQRLASSSSSSSSNNGITTRVLINNGEVAISVRGGVAALEEQDDDVDVEYGVDVDAAAPLSAPLLPGDKVEVFFVADEGGSRRKRGESESEGGSSGRGSFESGSESGSDVGGRRNNNNIDVDAERVRLARLFSSDLAAEAEAATAGGR